jgi:hypothetical protein
LKSRDIMKSLAAALSVSVVLSLLVLLSTRTTGAQQPQDLTTLIAREAPGFRLARVTDFVAVLQAKNRGESVLQEDFNRDGTRDWAAIVVNDRLREYRIYYVVSNTRGYEFTLLMTRSWQATTNIRPVNTPMFLKAAGDPGMSRRTYNSLTGDRTTYVSVPAIEVWTGQKHDERDTDLEDISYCSMTWYYENAMLKRFEACD